MDSIGYAIEQGASPNVDFHCHISYLQEGEITALPNTFVPMQDGGVSVCTGEWYCVSIYWAVGQNPDGSKFYELQTYMQEGPDDVYSQLKLRVSKRFNSLDEFVSGLTEENPEIMWGTSNSCSYANRYMVEFIRLENGEDLWLSSHKVTIRWELNPDGLKYSYENFYIPTSCGNITFSDESPPDTIFVDSVFCIDNGSHNVAINLHRNSISWAIPDTTIGDYVTLATNNLVFGVYQYANNPE